MRRHPLVFLCHITPYPPDGGAEIRSYHLLGLLAEEFDVTALCLGRAGEARPEAEKRAEQLSAATGARVITVPRAAASPRAALSTHVKSLVAGRVYTAFSIWSSEYAKRLTDCLRRFPACLVHVDSLDLCAYMPLLSLSNVICGHHNVESELLLRRAEGDSSRLRRAYIAHQSRLMATEERRWCPDVALNITVSQRDCEALRLVAPGSHVAVVPNGVDAIRVQPGHVARHGIIFVGGAAWFPNRDALAFFAKEILPLVRCQEDVDVTWVGYADPSALEVGRHAGIRMTGYVPDILPYLQSAACFVAPLRIGGGTRLKILDAWAAGLPVVSTTIGCEGLAAVDGDNIVVRDDPKAFADGIVGILRNPDLQRALGSAARRTVDTTYSWNVIGNEMLPLYRAVANGLGK